MAKLPRKVPAEVSLSETALQAEKDIDALVKAIRENQHSSDETVTLWIASPIRTETLQFIALELAFKLPGRKFAIYDNDLSRIIIRDTAGFLIGFDGCIPC